MTEGPLAGLRVVCFESRRSMEAARMIARQGGEAIIAPTLREVPLRGPAGVDALERELVARTPLLLILLTGVGTELLLEGLAQSRSRAEVVTLLGAETTTIVCRGPKPHAVLKSLGIKPAVVVGEPNTWVDVVREIDALELGRDRCVFVQEYGKSNAELLTALSERSPRVEQVKTYAWALPEDLAPLTSAIEQIAAGEADVALFTSGVQVTHLLQIAEQQGATAKLREGFRRVLVASVGPLCSDTLRASGFPPDIEPEHPKLGHLMLALAAEGVAKLAAKRAR